MIDTWERIHDAALTRHKDGGAELARLVIEADDLFQSLADRMAELEAENKKLREALDDAINEAMGVVPESADAFYNYRTGRVRAALQEKTDA